jgi:hypothetical protein
MKAYFQVDYDDDDGLFWRMLLTFQFGISPSVYEHKDY